MIRQWRTTAEVIEIGRKRTAATSARGDRQAKPATTTTGSSVRPYAMIQSDAAGQLARVLLLRQMGRHLHEIGVANVQGPIKEGAATGLGHEVDRPRRPAVVELAEIA